MSTRLTESLVELAALAWLESIGWRIGQTDQDIAPDQPFAERRDYGEGHWRNACPTRSNVLHPADLAPCDQPIRELAFSRPPALGGGRRGSPASRRCFAHIIE